MEWWGFRLIIEKSTARRCTYSRRLFFGLVWLVLVVTDVCWNLATEHLAVKLGKVLDVLSYSSTVLNGKITRADTPFTTNFLAGVINAQCPLLCCCSLLERGRRAGLSY